MDEIIKENCLIKKRCSEYSNHIKNQVVNIKPIDTHNISERLKKQAIQISLLLQKNQPIKTLLALTDLQAHATQIKPFYGKLYCKGQRLSLIMNITANEGLGCSYINFSFNTDRPRRKNCDKCVCLKKKNSVVRFTEVNPMARVFTHEWIYISLETESTCSIYFEFIYGNSKEFVIYSRIIKGKE